MHAITHFGFEIGDTVRLPDGRQGTYCGKPAGARWPAGVEEMAVVDLAGEPTGVLASPDTLTVVGWHRWLTA